MKQFHALDILKTGHNVFLAGVAGSGKTYILNQYISFLKNGGAKNIFFNFFFYFTITIFFCVIAGFTILPVFAFAAQEKIELNLSASAEQIQVGDTVMITLVIKAGTDSSNVQLNTLSIPGLENFQQTGSSNQTQFKSINGVSAITVNSTHKLLARKVGDFTIGPVVFTPIGSASTTMSNSIIIHVSEKDQSVLLGGSKDKNSNGQKEEEENSQNNIINDDEDENFETLELMSVRDLVLWTSMIAVFGLMFYLYFSKEKESTRSFVKKADNSNDKNISKDGMDNNENAETVQTSLLKRDHICHFQDVLNITDKTFYEKVSEQIILCAREKYGVKVPFGTISEIMESLKDVNISDNERHIFEKVLCECDIGKFAPEDLVRRENIIRLVNSM